MDYFSSERLRQGLRRKTIRGGVFTVLTQVLQVLVGIAVVPVLARLLDRADFGVAVKVTALTGFATLLVDAGLTFATVQRPDLNHRQASTLFWISALLGLVIGLVVAAAGPLVNLFYGDDRLSRVCLLLAFSYPFSGLAMQHQALLNRALQYERIAISRTASYLISNVACVWLAWRWQSYWALAWRPVIEAAVRAVTVWIACPWRPGPPRRGTGVRDMLGFGSGVTGASLIGYFSNQCDKILLGRYWTDEMTGLYERSMRCLVVPLQQAQGPVQSLVIPVLSRLSNEPERQKNAYLAVVARMLCVAGPLVAFLMVQSRAFVLTVLGPGYEDAVPIFAWLTLAGLVQPIASALRWMLLYQGRGAELVRVATANSVLAVVTILIGLPWGAEGVAAALVLGGIFVRLPVSLWQACRGNEVSASEVLRAVSRGLPLSLAVGAANLAVLGMAYWWWPIKASLVTAAESHGLSSSLAVWIADLAVELIASPWSPFKTLFIASAVSLVTWLAFVRWSPLGPTVANILARLRKPRTVTEPTAPNAAENQTN